jgi:hypothetical protein
MVDEWDPADEETEPSEVELEDEDETTPADDGDESEELY